MILHTVLQWLRWTTLYSQKTPHISPLWMSCGVSVASALEKIGPLIMTQHWLCAWVWICIQCYNDTALIMCEQYTVRSWYLVVTFFPNHSWKTSIALPVKERYVCLSRVWSLTEVLPSKLLCWVQYLLILYCDISRVFSAHAYYFN